MVAVDAKHTIVDLGMHNGDDTDFYLRKGFDVLAVEATPQLVEQAKIRFKDAIDAGRLTILNVAVTDHEGDIEFYHSNQELWSSIRADMADRGFGALTETMIVPCDTLDKILSNYPNPYYVKIDIEGADRHCIESLENLSEKPPYISFEADLADSNETRAMLHMLASYGYTRFKLVNQAIHSTRRMPNPAVEGQYVDAEFNKHMSGPFGEETPGSWMSLEHLLKRYMETVRRQAARIEYSSKGTVFGIPLTQLHAPLAWLYNTRAVTRARICYARKRGIEVGGWFDVHAAL